MLGSTNHGLHYHLNQFMETETRPIESLDECGMCSRWELVRKKDKREPGEQCTLKCDPQHM